VRYWRKTNRPAIMFTHRSAAESDGQSVCFPPILTFSAWHLLACRNRLEQWLAVCRWRRCSAARPKFIGLPENEKAPLGLGSLGLRRAAASVFCYTCPSYRLCLAAPMLKSCKSMAPRLVLCKRACHILFTCSVFRSVHRELSLRNILLCFKVSL
jgi:hypothetical protein